jgi:hypothetical protein
VKLHLSIQKATAAGALGSEDYAKAGHYCRAKKNLRRDFKKRISTKGIDFPEPYVAKVPLGTGVGNPPELVDYPFLLPHEVLAHLVAKRGMGVKRAGCMDTRDDQMFGDMKRKSCKDFKLDYDTCICIGFHGYGVPYTKSPKSASIEVFNWNLLNEFDAERHLFCYSTQGHNMCWWLPWQAHYQCNFGHFCLEHDGHAGRCAPFGQT